MRITLNLSTASSRRERYALAWAVPTAVVGILGLAMLSRLAWRNYRDYRSVHQSLVELQRSEGQLRDHEAALRRNLERPQLRETYRQAQFVNALINKKQFSLTELTEKVAHLLPAECRLSGLALARLGNEPVVRFTVMGTSDEAVEAFLINLEDSPDFDNVAILNQGFAEEGATSGPVTLACSARYLAGQAR